MTVGDVFKWDSGKPASGVPAHKTSHQNGGSDEISVAGLSGLLADGQTPLAHKTSHQNGGSDEISVAGLSGLLADGQTPLAHATSHRLGGSDLIKLDDLGTPDDNTDLNASTTRHGLLAKLSGSTVQYLRGDGTWTNPFPTNAAGVLKNNGSGTLSWQPWSIGCRLSNSTAINLTHNVWTTLTFDSEQFDSDSMHSTTVNTNRITFTRAGTYLVSCHLQVDPNATGMRGLICRFTGGSNYVAVDTKPAVTTATWGTTLQVTTIYQFAAADWVDFAVFQNSGGTIQAMSSAYWSPRAAAYRLGD